VLARHEEDELPELLPVCAKELDDLWGSAVEQLRSHSHDHITDARKSVDLFVRRYDGRRASMVVDVVISRQRRYTARVVPMVKEYETRNGHQSLAQLAESGSALAGLRKGEDMTIRGVARGLVEFGASRQLESDDAVVRKWADATEGLEVAHELDTFVGQTLGIGPALYAYLRMRSGGDSIKPDVRVRDKLREFGFSRFVPRDAVGLFVLARSVAAEIGVSMLELDQLLWGPEEGESTVS
jgi:hypothetical protein